MPAPLKNRNRHPDVYGISELEKKSGDAGRPREMMTVRGRPDQIRRSPDRDLRTHYHVERRMCRKLPWSQLGAQERPPRARSTKTG